MEQRAAHIIRQVRLGQQQADVGIQFVHVANGGDALAVLAGAAAVAQPGGAGVTGAGGDLGQAVTHAGLPRLGLKWRNYGPEPGLRGGFRGRFRALRCGPPRDADGVEWRDSPETKA
ncbi:hypothetical protein D3C86_1289380 [compost metagenome]